MIQRPRRSARVFVFASAVILCVCALAFGPRVFASAQPGQTDIDRLAAALERVRDRGSYRFDGDVTQVTMPSATIGNIGRTSRTDQFHVDGTTDLRKSNLEMNLWSGGTVQQKDSALGVRVQGGKTFVRQGSGEWKEDSSFSTDGLAPQGV